MAKHVCRNAFAGEGANGGCFFEIEASEKKERAHLRVGWSCVIVLDKEIPVTWLAEIIAIATEHKDGIAGFIRDNLHAVGGRSYALECDPPETK